MPLSTSGEAVKAVAGSATNAETPTNSSRRASDGDEIVWPLPRDRSGVSASHTGSVAFSRANLSDDDGDEGSEGSEVVWRMTPRPDKLITHAAIQADSSDTGSGIASSSGAVYTRKKQPPSRPFSARSRDADEHSVASGGSGVAVDAVPHKAQGDLRDTVSGATPAFTASVSDVKAVLHMQNTPSYSSVSPSRSEFRPRGNSVLLSDDEREVFSTARLPLETADEQAQRLRDKLITSIDGLKLSKAPSPSSSPVSAPRVAAAGGLMRSPVAPREVTSAGTPPDSPHVTMVGDLNAVLTPSSWGLGDVGLTDHGRNATNIFADGAALHSHSPADTDWSTTGADLTNASPLPGGLPSSAERRDAKRRRKEERAAKRAAKEQRRAQREAERNAGRADGAVAPVPTTTTTGAWNVQPQPPIVSSEAHTTPALGDGPMHGAAPLTLSLATPAAALGERGLDGSGGDSQGLSSQSPATAATNSRAGDVSFALTEAPASVGTAATVAVVSASAAAAAAAGATTQEPIALSSTAAARLLPRGLVQFPPTSDMPSAVTRQSSLRPTEGSRSGFGPSIGVAAASKELHTRELDVATGMSPNSSAASRSGRVHRAGAARPAAFATQPREALGKSQLKGYAPSHAKRRLKRRHHHHRGADKDREEPAIRVPAALVTPKSSGRQEAEPAHARDDKDKDRDKVKDKDKDSRPRRHSRRHSNRKKRHSGKPAVEAARPPAAAASPVSLSPSPPPAKDKNLQEPYSQPHYPHPPASLPVGDRDGTARDGQAVPRRCTSAAGPTSRTPVPPALARGESHNLGAGGERPTPRRYSAVPNLGHPTSSAPNVVPSGYSGSQPPAAALYGGAQSSRDPHRSRGGGGDDDVGDHDGSRLRPTPPPAVAGSAAAAVLELKHQKELAASAADERAQSSASPPPPQRAPHLHPPLRADDGSEKILIQQVESFSSSASRSHHRDSARRPRPHTTAAPARAPEVARPPPPAASARSVESDYYSSYTNSRDDRRDHREQRASCSSFDSYTSDPRTDSSYGYSSYTYSSSASDSELLCEKIPPRPGSRVSPPLLLFTDLQHRHMMAQRMDLRRHAETGVIYEWSLRDGGWDRVETQVVIASEPFSHGNMRASYFMIDLQRLDCKLVAKRYLKSSVEDNQYFDDVSMHSISGHWARLYNAAKPPKEVRFVPAAVLELTERTPPLLLAMEPQLEGTFTKYNNNSGYVPKNARWTPQAFSHFTYHVSNHQLLIVDIQGVSDIYTDPQILSPDGEGYGRGNLGLKGIRRFLSTHKCNKVCEGLRLPPIQHRREAHGSESRLEKSDYVLPENIAREQLPPKAYKTTDVQRTRSMNNSQAGASVLVDSFRGGQPAVVMAPAMAGPGVVGGGMLVPSAPGAVPGGGPASMHDPRFMQHIRNAVSRQKSNYFAPAAGMLPVTPSPSGYPAEASSGKIKSANSTVLMAGSDVSVHSGMASNINVSAPLTQPAQPQRPAVPPVVMPYLRPLASINSSPNQNANMANTMTNSSYQYSPRPSSWMPPGGGGYNYAPASKSNADSGPDTPAPVMSAVEERWPGRYHHAQR